MSTIPEQFDLNDINVYLMMTGITTKNRMSCMRVIKKLVAGKGVTHKNKPGEAFLKGYKLKPGDDIEGFRQVASLWLPYRKGPGCLDKGHGWCLNHPLKKLVMYKKHRLNSP